jgi:hypothetical protein
MTTWILAMVNLFSSSSLSTSPFFIDNYELENQQTHIFTNYRDIISELLSQFTHLNSVKSKIECLRLIYNLLFGNHEIIAEFVNLKVVDVLKVILNDEVKDYLNPTTKSHGLRTTVIINVIHIFKELICVKKFMTKVIDAALMNPFKKLVQNISFNCSKDLLTAIIEFFTVYFQQPGYSQLFFENDIISILMKLAFVDEICYLVMNAVRRLMTLSQSELSWDSQIQIMEKLISQGLLHRMFHLLKTMDFSNLEKKDIQDIQNCNSVLYLLPVFSHYSTAFTRQLIDYSFLPIFHDILSCKVTRTSSKYHRCKKWVIHALGYILEGGDDVITRILIDGFFPLLIQYAFSKPLGGTKKILSDIFIIGSASDINLLAPDTAEKSFYVRLSYFIIRTFKRMSSLVHTSEIAEKQFQIGIKQLISLKRL